MKPMYHKTTYRTNKLTGNDHFEGVSIEQELEKAINEKKPIEKNSISSIFYTRRKNGVLPECDIRTDRWERGQQAMTKVAETNKQNIIKLHQDTDATRDTDKSAEH